MAKEKPNFIDPFVDAAQLPARVLLRRRGYTPPPPSTLDAYHLPGRLYEFIYAMAGLRVFLQDTDHLDDRALYECLHERWLAQAVSDLPPGSQWNQLVSVRDLDGTADTVDDFALFPGDGLVDSPHDRDRWLPKPPTRPSPAATEELLPFDDEEDVAESTPPDKPAGNDGPKPAPANGLSDETVTARLWEILHHQACRRSFIFHTDHLGDRELYNLLWESGLRDDTPLPKGRPDPDAWTHDVIDGRTPENIQAWLRYYASDRQRAHYSKTFPEVDVPPRGKPPFARDWRLPQPWF